MTEKTLYKHGLAARKFFIPGEDESVFHENYREFMKTLRPDGIVEFDPVEQMCMALWLKDRAIRMQTLAFERCEIVEIPKDLRLFMRYQTTNENLYFRALRALQAIQKQKVEEDKFASRQRFEPDLKHPMEPRETPEPIGFVSPIVQNCARYAQPEIPHNAYFPRPVSASRRLRMEAFDSAPVVQDCAQNAQNPTARHNGPGILGRTQRLPALNEEGIDLCIVHVVHKIAKPAQWLRFANQLLN